LNHGKNCGHALLEKGVRSNLNSGSIGNGGANEPTWG
jgi:hypothetical protein